MCSQKWMCGLVPNSYIQVSVSHLYIPRIGLPIGRPIIGIYKFRTWMWKLEDRTYCIIPFWNQQGRADSFLRIHKSEQDIYIGFSPALHLKCSAGQVDTGLSLERWRLVFELSEIFYFKIDSSHHGTATPCYINVTCSHQALTSCHKRHDQHRFSAIKPKHKVAH